MIHLQYQWEYLSRKIDQLGKKVLWFSGALTGCAVTHALPLFFPRYGTRIYIAIALLIIAWMLILLREMKRCLKRMKADLTEEQRAMFEAIKAGSFRPEWRD